MNPCPLPASALPLTAYSGQPLFISAAQSITLQRQANITTQRIILNAGSGAYLVNVTLSDAGAASGDIYRLILLFPPSTNPSVQIIDSLAGNLTDSVDGTGFIYQTAIEMTFNGVTWEVDEQSA